jgi:DNA-binding IclR family transcriptional regulator
MTLQVKSAVRVLEVFEFFDRVQREATVGEIARELGYPQSSASVLLASLAERGYLCHGVDRRSYFPTPRVTMLGSWLEPMLVPSGPVQQLMRELGDATGDTVILGTPLRDQVQYIHVVPATTTMRLHVGPGTLRPLLTSGLGRLFLMDMPEDQLRHLVLRHNDGPDVTEKISLAALRRDLQTIRAQGYAVSLNRVSAGAGVIGVRLPVEAGNWPLAIGIGGWSRNIRSRQDEIVGLLRAGVERHFNSAAPAEARAARRPRRVA